MKILVTGGAGFIGSQARDRLLSRGAAEPERHPRLPVQLDPLGSRVVLNVLRDFWG